MALPLKDRLMIDLWKFAYSAKENIDLTDFLNVDPSTITVTHDPFPHLVVPNFFTSTQYQALCAQFDEVMARGLTRGKEDTIQQFHAFDIDYDGYVYTPEGTIDSHNPLSIFYSLAWNSLFSKLFNQTTSFETMVAFHHHPAGDRTGFVHNDSVERHFSSQHRLPNGVMYASRPAERRVMRKIAILYYLKNGPWHEGDGGETGLYARDQQTLAQTVPPIDNTLFAFLIGPESYHAFQGNSKERNSIVQWLHVPIA